MNQHTPPTRSKRKLFIGSGLALVGIAAVVVMVVLPAEYGIDPTGVGKATGLIKVSQPDNEELQRGALRTGVLTLASGVLEPVPGQTDHWEVELEPYQSVEFKYTIPEGGRMNFHWRASGEVHYDMHSHPFDGGTDLTESYGIGDAKEMKGKYVAAFSGIHGWYWQNRSFEKVTVTLDASGAFTSSTVFANSGEEERPIPAN
jgi:hypothetical protein